MPNFDAGKTTGRLHIEKARQTHMRNAALRAAADPQRLARALRTICAALDLGLVSPADVLTYGRDHEQAAS